MNGWLANAVQRWGMLASPVSAAVRDPDETPYCTSFTDDALSRVLTEQWDHSLVLAAVAGACPAALPRHSNSAKSRTDRGKVVRF